MSCFLRSSAREAVLALWCAKWEDAVAPAGGASGADSGGPSALLEFEERCDDDAAALRSASRMPSW
jgi:hypothetical protein